jgi:peptide/nickel transport system permease protein
MRGLTLGYLLRRLGMFVLTIWLGATIIFFVPRLAPGDPITAMVSRMSAQAGNVENSGAIIEAWKARFGLNAPLYIQYLRFLRNAVTFDLGYSITAFPTGVTELVARSLPWTLGLLTTAVLISFIAGNTIGALLAWRGTPTIVKNLLPLSLTFTSIPFFMLAILLIYVFAFGLHWFPTSGAYGRGVIPGLNWGFISSVVYYGTLPVLAIVVTSMGFWALGMRGMMITTAGEDYLILSQAKGLRPSRIFWRYAVRNAVLPQVTALALTFGSLIGGNILVEYLFAYPGTGYLLYQGILNADYPLIEGIVFMLILATATAVLIIDLIYPLLDPRITYQKR